MRKLCSLTLHITYMPVLPAQLLGHSTRGQAALQTSRALFVSNNTRSPRVFEFGLAVRLRQHAVDAHHPVLAREHLLKVSQPTGHKARRFSIPIHTYFPLPITNIAYTCLLMYFAIPLPISRKSSTLRLVLKQLLT